MTLEGLPLPMLIWRGRSTTHFESEFGISLADLGWINTDPGGGHIEHSTWKVEFGITLQIRGAIQHWSWGGQSTLKLERICKDFGRIASVGKDLQRPWKDAPQSWKGSTMTLEGSPQLGKDPQWPLKDCLNLEGIWQWLWKRSPLPMLIQGGGLIDTHFVKWSWDYLADLGSIVHWSQGGSINYSLGWKVAPDWDYLADLGWIDTDPGGGKINDSLWDSEVGITLQIWGGSTLDAWGEGSCDIDFGRIASDNANPGGGGGSINTARWNMKLGLPCRSGVDQHCSRRRGHRMPQRLWKDRLWWMHDPGGDQSTLNLERIHNDWKDRLCQCWSWGRASVPPPTFRAQHGLVLLVHFNIVY